MQPTFRGQNNLSEQVYLSGGDIYGDPSLLRFYQNDDTPPWGNNKLKEKGEDVPEWVVIILEMDEDELVPIILRWPFLATARAVIDVHEGKLSLRVGSETVTFNIRKSMKSKHSEMIILAQTTTNDAGTSTTLIPGHVTTEEKAQKKNDVKERSMLLMALPNEHLMTFNQYKDEDLVCFYRNKIWNKSDLDTTSINDLYNHFKIVRQEVKGTACSNLSSQNMAFVSSPSPSSTNEVPTTYGVSTASTQCSTAGIKVSTANLSDATVYAFLSNKSNGSQLVHEDLEQIHEDDLEEIDLKWQLALLSMRVKKFFQKTRRKITINGSDAAGFDKPKVESWNQDSSRRSVHVKEITPKAMVAIDEVGFEWSYMAEDEVPTNMALTAFLDSEASKSLDKLIGSQVIDKSRKGVGFESYNAVPPPRIRLFSPPKIDLSYSGLEEFQQPEFERYGPKSSKIESKNTSENIPNELKESTNVKESFDVPLAKKLVSDDKLEKKTIVPTDAKIEFIKAKQQEKPVRKPVKYVEMYRLTAIIIKGKGWNMAPRAVLIKTGLRPLNTARPVNTVHPKTTVHYARPMPHFSKLAQSTVKRPYQQRTSLTNTSFSKTVNTTRTINTARPRPVNTIRPRPVNTTRPNSSVVNAVMANQILRNSMEDMLPLGGGGENGGRITGTEETIGKGNSSKETGSCQDYILIPLWKDGLLFDSSSKNATNDEPQSSCDAANKDDNGVNKDSGIDAHEKSANSINDVNTVGPSITTASTDFDTGSLNINTVSPTVSWFWTNIYRLSKAVWMDLVR
nr:hypothetical protein [Tanacetum cinerariifolium]